MQEQTVSGLELPVARAARRRLGLDDAFFEPEGGLAPAELATAELATADLGRLRRLAQRLNEARDVLHHPERGVSAGQLNALGLVQGFLRLLVARYRSRRGERLFDLALAWLEARFGAERLERALERFAALFPVPAAQPAAATAAESETTASPRERALEEMLLVFMANENPAYEPFRDLFDDAELEAETGYRELMAGLEEFFAEQAASGAEEHSLMDLLREPARAAPTSLREQLEWLVRNEGERAAGGARDDVADDPTAASRDGAAGESEGVPPPLAERWLMGLDVIREEQKPVFWGPPEPGAVEVELPDLAELVGEEERFSEDRGWMGDVVMIAKSCYVWLDQLSRRHGREIARLDQIPDEELDRLAAWGINALWLIGIWERSRASERIKRLCGNPEAAASAYSLYDMAIAEELGGEAAYEDLRERARERGIRLACDMVPNHTGIDSRWMVEHPERFLSLPECPFPTYTFDGPDLSSDPRMSVFLEDHYYDRSDAAVVFQRVDRRSGEVRYVYHGNDGTSLPWNDTAQLDYLNPETREAVIETILEVARRFPIIRFDAAMTLAKRHVQRLWYPPPGSGGDIPSRAEHGLSQEAFDRHMPEELWREVVDRVAAEVPDTLLLAEAFWLMEGYFVRSLGMHRVYNSAFMHMLRDEENAKLRRGLKETLELDPGILQRYVNFLTNPDEKTAFEQFGGGDKYFGVCTLMATLPGLPMLGHGQVEGLREKYGMEYRRAYRDEGPDAELVARHEREIVPLLERRSLFAGVESFRLFDLTALEGRVAEDVLTYANGRGGQRVVVAYHNRHGSAHGWLRHTVPFRDKERDVLRREDLAAVLGLGSLEPDADDLDAGGSPAAGSAALDDLFCLYRDAVSGLEFVRDARELTERGLFLALGPYERRVLWDFRQVADEDGSYRRLCEALHGHGVPSVERALREQVVQPVLAPVGELLSARTLRRLLGAVAAEAEPPTGLLAELAAHLEDAFTEIAPLLRADLEATGGEPPVESGPPAESEPPVEVEVLSTVEQAAAEPPRDDEAGPAPAVAAEVRATLESLLDLRLAEERAEDVRWAALLAWAFLRSLGGLVGDAGAARDLFDRWLLDRPVRRALEELGADAEAARLAVSTLRFFLGLEARLGELADEPDIQRLAGGWHDDEEARRFLEVHRFDAASWFRREPWRELVWWLPRVLTAVTEEEPAGLRADARALAAELAAAEAPSGYRWLELLALLGVEEAEAGPPAGEEVVDRLEDVRPGDEEPGV